MLTSNFRSKLCLKLCFCRITYSSSLDALINSMVALHSNLEDHTIVICRHSLLCNLPSSSSRHEGRPCPTRRWCGPRVPAHQRPRGRALRVPSRHARHAQSPQLQLRRQQGLQLEPLHAAPDRQRPVAAHGRRPSQGGATQGHQGLPRSARCATAASIARRRRPPRPWPRSPPTLGPRAPGVLVLRRVSHFSDITTTMCPPPT